MTAPVFMEALTGFLLARAEEAGAAAGNAPGERYRGQDCRCARPGAGPDRQGGRPVRRVRADLFRADGPRRIGADDLGAHAGRPA